MPHEHLATGVIVPMITPFRADGTVDTEAAERLTSHVIAGRAAPFVLGTTGESASIPIKERKRLVQAVVRTTKGKMPVYAGISSTSLAESQQYGRDYFRMGVDAVVAHMPAYYPLTGEYLDYYFSELADDLPGPLILYNIPAVTHQSLPLEVIDRLSHHSRIIAVKDSERDHGRLDQSLRLWSGRSDFNFLVGWGAMMAEGLMNGASGIVPSTGNLIPELYADLYEAAVAGNRGLAEEIQNHTSKISEVYQKGFSLGESLAALKVILHAKDLCEPFMLPPLYRLGSEQEAKILQNYKKF